MASRLRPHAAGRPAAAFALALTALITPAAAAEVTFIHMGDVHGHMVPRPSLQPKTPNSGKTLGASKTLDASKTTATTNTVGATKPAVATEGGLARMMTTINEIRARRTRGKTLLINTGDTIQGSAEALFTRGQALVDVLNRFRIDAYTPGNWDWVYGVERALELFTGDAPKAPWNALAANAYFDGEPYADRARSRVQPPNLIRRAAALSHPRG
jgi:2',3'-cyclic-nucleotide 2'-phosphodiesterase (5'-nucleotidase family)